MRQNEKEYSYSLSYISMYILTTTSWSDTNESMDRNESIFS
uniref:ORF42j n=1 Tax=Pinus koraiensis TaxID=88728 RepID=A4QMA4_PINKO|nr:ORF42j [Pinus koraiensis]ABP35441.1 ORF42j [Pinus koraiensis]